MSYSLMLSPCLPLGLDLQCFTWLGKMILQRFIDIHFQRLAVRLRFRGCLLFSLKLSPGLRDPTTYDQYLFISHLLKTFQNSPFNEPDSSCYSTLSRSMPRETILDSSELVIFNVLCESSC